MAFLPGNKLGKGRPKGSLSKRTQNFKAILEEHNFCPVTAMIECYREAKKVYDSYGTIYDAICEARIEKNDLDGSYAAPPEDKAHTYLKIAGDLAKDIASYTYPKLKAIEQTRPKSTDGMTLQEKLQAVKDMQRLIEAQIKADGPGTV